MASIPKWEAIRETVSDVCSSDLETEGKMFRFVQSKMDESEYVFTFDEFEKEKLLEGSEVIRNLADDHLSDSDDETLQYVARVMPYPFTKGTKYEKKNPKW